MQDVRTQLAREIAKDCKTVEEVHTMLKDLFKRTLQEVLEAEMTEHLDTKGNHTGNSRNGYSKKNDQDSLTELQIPRDRNGEFDPQIIKKYEFS